MAMQAAHLPGHGIATNDGEVENHVVTVEVVSDGAPAECESPTATPLSANSAHDEVVKNDKQTNAAVLLRSPFPAGPYQTPKLSKKGKKQRKSAEKVRHG
jgi:hypothetical protein